MTTAILTKRATGIHVIFPATGKPIVTGLSQFEAIKRANKENLKLVEHTSKAGKVIAETHGLNF